LGVGKGGKRPVQTSDLFDEDEGQDEEDGLFEEMEGQEGEEFPSFFGSELADALGTARKSLVLLRAANPDHPLLCGSGSGSTRLQKEVEWLWSEEDVEAAWVGRMPTRKDEGNANTQVNEQEVLDVGELKAYKPELAAQFGVFDLEPGVTSSIFHVPSYPGNNVPISTSLSSPVQSFISRFPSSLPSITPTLTHLNELTFAPLVSHASELSKALLGLFLPISHSQHSSPSSSNLNFSEHLILLRSYILLTSHAFKSRLAAALFSDSGEYDVHSDEVDIRARARQLKFNRDQDKSPANEDRLWAVGLAPALTDRECWPPGGADLSFLLRTVIVDSLDEGRLDQSDGEESENENEMRGGSGSVVLGEAEWRLGFAIRDLPVGAGRDRWLNPTCEWFIMIWKTGC
jgi:hypothetical protein